MGLSARWSRLSILVRITLIGYALGFTVGTLSHLVDVLSYGADVYAAAPGPLRTFFVSLALLDPLVVALVLGVRVSGVWLGCLVVLVDLMANWYLELAHDAVEWTHWERLALQSVFGLYVLATALPLWRRLAHK